MATRELKNDEWKEFIQADYAVVDCYGQNCVACVMLEPVYNKIADELTGISFGRLDISYYPGMADQYGINAMPTVMFFRKGKLVDQVVGSVEREELLAAISKFLYQ